MYQNVNARVDRLFLLIKRIVFRGSRCCCYQERMKAAGFFSHGKDPGAQVCAKMVHAT